MGIVLTAYNQPGEEIDNNNGNAVSGASYNYYFRLDFSDYSPVSYFGNNEYIGKDKSELDERLESNRSDSGLIHFDYSSNGFYYALTSLDKRSTGIYYADGLNLRVLDGSKGIFSNDGKYIACIENDKILLYPAEVSEMIRLVKEEKILGPIQMEPEDQKR
jgi:hypothetical protein